jgi:hypothetical protein
MGFLAPHSSISISVSVLVPVCAALVSSCQGIDLKEPIVLGRNNPASASVESPREINFSAPLERLGSLPDNLVWLGVHGPS